MYYVQHLLHYPFLILLRSISSGSKINNPLLQMLATFGAEIIQWKFLLRIKEIPFLKI